MCALFTPREVTLYGLSILVHTYMYVLLMLMSEFTCEHERSSECTQLPVLSSDWSVIDFGNVTNAGVLIDVPRPSRLRVKFWLVRLLTVLFLVRFFIHLINITHKLLLHLHCMSCCPRKVTALGYAKKKKHLDIPDKSIQSMALLYIQL